MPVCEGAIFMELERLEQAAPCGGTSLALRCMLFLYTLCPAEITQRQKKRQTEDMQMRQLCEMLVFW